MYRSLLFVLPFACLLLGLAGCGGPNPDEVPAPPAESKTTTTEAGKVGGLDVTAGGDFNRTPANTDAEQLKDSSNQGLEQVEAGQAGTR